MENQSDNLHMFQKTLNDDADMKSNFAHAPIPESEDEENSSDSETESCKIVLPKRAKKKNNNTSQELLFQLLLQHKTLSKTQKKVYKLQSELDSEEIKMRYVKLDLNNTQVNLDNTKSKLELCNKELLHARIENWVVRVCFLLYILHSLYSIIA